jgi:hypothetical protein
MRDRARRSGRDQAEIAMIYTGLGDKDKAFAWLGRVNSNNVGAAYEWLGMTLTELEPDPRVATARQRLLIQKR